MRGGSGKRKGRKTGTKQYQQEKNIAKRKERNPMSKEDRRMGERETRSQK